MLYALVQRIDEEPAVAVALREGCASGRSAGTAVTEPDWIALTEIDAAGFYRE